MIRSTLALFLVLALVPCSAFSAQDIKSKDPLERIKAVLALADADDPKAEAKLLAALKDDDWEVVEAALVTLGQVGSPKSAAKMTKVVLGLPLARLRTEGARSAAKLDAQGVYNAMAKKLAKEPLLACDVLNATAEYLDGKVELKAFKRALKSKEPEARAAAAGTITRLAGDARGERVADFLASPDVMTQTATLDALIERPDPALLELLVETLRTKASLVDVVERRLAEAVRAAVLVDEKAGRVVLPLLTSKSNSEASDEVRARLIRTIGTILEERDDNPSLGATWREDSIVLKGIADDLDSSSLVRRAQAGVLMRLGTKDAAAAARTAARAEKDGHVRRILLEAVLTLSTVEDDDTLNLVVALSTDPDPRVRERAVVALGVRDLEGADKALIAALDDEAWEVATSAAISLGIQHAESARVPLQKMAQHADWQRRAAGVYGLTKLRAREALGVFLSALEDAEPLIQRIAWVHLKELSNQEHEIDDVSAWREWLENAGERVRMEIPPEVLKRRKELGYTRDPRALYEGLDVVVFDSRAGGDRMQDVLGFLEIEHRFAHAGQVAEAGVHPDAIYVANCPGEISPDDAERLAWFVHAGGYLFGSCWSLQETIARSIPGYVQRFETNGEVMDDVFCVGAKGDSPYLRGVFEPGVSPSYALIGAYLIDVIDPELVEVLVDSPACAAHWGNGTMAAWFRVGHGVVLDSVNHFDVQGFERAQGLKKVEDRWAYAMDHLGLTFAELRATRKEKYWKKSNQVAKNVKDLSVLRLITNFVLDQRKRN